MQSMKKSKRTTNEPREETAAERAVKQYRAVENDLERFMKDPEVRDTLLQYHDLITKRNERLDEAVHTVKQELQQSDKAKLFIDGIGAQKRTRVYYDIDHLRAYLPPEQLSLVVTERVVYDLNTDDLVRLARQGELDSEVVRQAYKEEAQTPASLPGTPKPWVIPAITMEDDNA